MMSDVTDTMSCISEPRLHDRLLRCDPGRSNALLRGLPRRGRPRRPCRSANVAPLRAGSSRSEQSGALRKESPAVVNLLAHDATVTAAGMRATVVDLAARGWLRILPPVTDDETSRVATRLGSVRRRRAPPPRASRPPAHPRSIHDRPGDPGASPRCRHPRILVAQVPQPRPRRGEAGRARETTVEPRPAGRPPRSRRSSGSSPGMRRATTAHRSPWSIRSNGGSSPSRRSWR